jgi:lipopolysaccharide/colanic/teichoic acid biosynthesis glycosyltransferase
MLFPPGMPRIKRMLDLSGSLLGLIILSPFLLVLALLIRVNLGTPVLFRQPRAGYKGRIFHIYKFRTMTDARGLDGNLPPDIERLKPLGVFLRAASLDELPELINILRGEMSLVGPRPLLEEYLALYSPDQMRRHEVYPGLSGWAQVNGRNALTWEEKFKLDLWYVKNWSFWLDIRILLLTPSIVFRHRNVNQPGRATADRFTGNE